MATVIKVDFGEGGANLVPLKTGGDPTLVEALRDSADDSTEIRAQFVALLAKLDADVGINDVDYAATLTPAAQQLTKG